jgi:hypothetical protein
MRSGARHRESDFSVGTDSINFPSLGSANSSGGVKESSGSGNKKTTNTASAAIRDDNMEEESVGSKMLVEQILQEEEQMARPSFLKGLKDLCAPAANNNSKQQQKKKKQRQRVSFSLNVEEDSVADRNEQQMHNAERGGGNDEKKRRDVESTSRSGLKWCTIIAVLTIAVTAAVVCFVAIPSSLNGRGGELDETNNLQQQGRGQELLELAEQITIACGESSLLSSITAAGDAKSGMATCQDLCHNHMCCVEQEEEYSCKNDVTRDCAVYAGCVALIDDNFW